VSQVTDALERLLAQGRDDALLRFSLGNAYLTTDLNRAIEHFERAVNFDPTYSAAWKLLGKALTSAGETSRARAVFEQGITTAEHQGDIQAAKEMRIFLKRLG
jgi:Tfp pilus assembly protein PilF